MPFDFFEEVPDCTRQTGVGVKPLPARLSLVNLLEIGNASPKMQRGAIAASGRLASGHGPSVGGKGNKYNTES